MALTTARLKWAGFRRWRASSITNQGTVSPIFTSFRPILKGPSVPMRRSAASAMKAPAATVCPEQAVITGRSNPRIRSASVAPSVSISITCSTSPPAKTFRSKPAEK